MYGDFWHGYRFPARSHKLSEFWQDKIEKNRTRDQRNFRKLRQTGWRIIRLWQHEVENNLKGCVGRNESALR